ncbi:MAG TPA: hypothetical protein VK152_07565 [Paludibacter sp.]|nr:hypothetical protein [Paludibacter sp.]
MSKKTVYDFNANRGKAVLITKTDNSSETGILLDLAMDDVVVLEETVNGITRIIEIELSDISKVVEVDEKPKYEFNGFFLIPLETV